MKNKLFWPIILISVVIIVESIMLLSGNNKVQVKETENMVEVTPSEEVEKEVVINFEFQNVEGKTVLVMKAEKEVAVDAIDLYIAYKGMKIGEVKNLGELPKPTFFKVSQEKSLVVFNYLISESEGYKLAAGQEVKVAEINYTLSSTEDAVLSIDPKTQVVETGSAKVLPFSSQNLIINSTL